MTNEVNNNQEGYDCVYDFSGGFARVRQGKKWFLIGKNGERVSGEYDFITPRVDEIYRGCKNGKWSAIVVL